MKQKTWKIQNLCLIDYQLSKTAGLAGLEGLLSLLLQKVEGLADFGEILAFICESLKRGKFARAAMVMESVQSSLPSTRLVFVFFNWKLRFRQYSSEPVV